MPIRQRSIVIVVPAPAGAEPRWARASMRAHPLSASDLVAFRLGFELRSVQQTADVLGLTQSAVTKRIQALERRTSTCLFERGRFGIRPTPAAVTLYPLAVAALEALALAEAAIGERPRDPDPDPDPSADAPMSAADPDWNRSGREAMGASLR